MVLTCNEGPEVQPYRAMQSFIGAAESIVHEEACSHQGKDDQHCAEENDAHMDTCRDNFEQIWKN